MSASITSATPRISVSSVCAEAAPASPQAPSTAIEDTNVQHLRDLGMRPVSDDMGEPFRQQE
jgi:hypothetical protein